jgi:hypothetical protein
MFSMGCGRCANASQMKEIKEQCGHARVPNGRVLDEEVLLGGKTTTMDTHKLWMSTKSFFF